MGDFHYYFERRPAEGQKPMSPRVIEQVRRRGLLARRKIAVTATTILGLAPIIAEGYARNSVVAIVMAWTAVPSLIVLGIYWSGYERLGRLRKQADIVTFRGASPNSKPFDAIMPVGVMFDRWGLARHVHVDKLGASSEPPVVDFRTLPMVRRLSASEMAELQRSRLFRVQTGVRFLVCFMITGTLTMCMGLFVYELTVWFLALIAAALPSLLPAVLSDRHCRRVLANPTVRAASEAGRVVETLVATGRIWSSGGQPAPWRITELT